MLPTTPAGDAVHVAVTQRVTHGRIGDVSMIELVVDDAVPSQQGHGVSANDSARLIINSPTTVRSSRGASAAADAPLPGDGGGGAGGMNEVTYVILA